LSRLEKLRQNRSEQPLVYSRTEKVKEPHYRGWAALTIIGLLIGGLIYILFFSGFFNIKNVVVEGYDNPEKIKEIVAEQGGGGRLANNIFLYNKNNLAETLTGSPLISEIQIRKILPNKIIIQIYQSKPALIWSTAGDKYLIDERGVVMGKHNDEKLPEVYDSADIKVEKGEKVASPTFINFIRVITDGFTPATSTRISKILIFDLITDIHVLTSDGWTVYLDASKDPSTELNNLTKVLTEAKKSSKKLEYIDLRQSKRAFYK